MKNPAAFIFLAFTACAFFTGCSCGDDDSGDDEIVTDDTGDDAADDDSSDDATDDSAADDTVAPGDDTGDDTSGDDSSGDDTVADDSADDDSSDDTADDDSGDDTLTDDTADDTAADDTSDDDSCDGVVNPPVNLPGFLLGISQGNSTNAIQYLPELGIHWYRQGISLRSVKSTVTDPELTMADIEADPTLIEQFMDEVDWTSTDNNLLALIAAGIQPLPSVGLGWIGTLPDLNGETATPDALGKDHYLAQMYRYVRAVVERYDGDGYRDADGIVIKIWQIENELNQAMITTLYGWREPTGLAGLTSAWADWNFLTDLLTTLNNAVHDSDPEAITTQNLHTDIHPNFSHLLSQPSWIEAATLWRDLMDVVGFDAYPNYYQAEPVLGTVVGERVTTLFNASCGKPIIIMETGYPAGPSDLGFSEDLQAQYIDDAFHSAYDAGVSGYFQFGLKTSDTHSVQITPTDIQNLAIIGPLFTNGNVLQLLAWVVANLSYVTDPHFLQVLQSVEGYWGVVRPDGTHKPGFDMLQSIASEIGP